MPYLLFLIKRLNLKLSSAANYRWRYMGLFIYIPEVVGALVVVCTSEIGERFA